MHLVDAHLTSDPGKYLAAALLSLSTMLHLGLPHINALSKVAGDLGFRVCCTWACPTFMPCPRRGCAAGKATVMAGQTKTQVAAR